jgi:hypothetical protein
MPITRVRRPIKNIIIYMKYTDTIKSTVILNDWPSFLLNVSIDPQSSNFLLIVRIDSVLINTEIYFFLCYENLIYSTICVDVADNKYTNRENSSQTNFTSINWRCC